jgi:hypothetical protein
MFRVLTRLSTVRRKRRKEKVLETKNNAHDVLETVVFQSSGSIFFVLGPERVLLFGRGRRRRRRRRKQRKQRRRRRRERDERR